MKRLLLRAGLILWLATLAGGASAIWFYSERYSPSVDALAADVILATGEEPANHRLDLTAAKQAFDQGNAVFVDARSAPAYEAGHIPGALHLPAHASTARLRQALASYPADTRLITYCAGSGCRSSYTLAKRLVEESVRAEVHVLTGGWPAWQAAGFPVAVGGEAGP